MAHWRMKGHAMNPFFRWLASWAVAINTPSDIGYSDDGFVLPPLAIHDHIIEGTASSASLFPELSISGIGGRLAARRGSAEAARLVQLDGQWIVWCGLNDESDAITSAIDGAVNVEGSDAYDDKRRAVKEFCAGRIRVLVTKPKILGFGMNFQQCAQMAFVGLSDSYESYYQCLRRCWRFGQKKPVDAHIIVSRAESIVVENVRRKQAAARDLSQSLIAHMRDFEREALIA